MDSATMPSSFEDCKPETQKLSICDHTGSFVVDMERFSHHLTDKDVTANSRTKLQRSFSRKGSQQRETSSSSSSSPRATPEKSMVVTFGATTDNHTNHPQGHHHHQMITITTTANTTGGGGGAESKYYWGGKRFSFKRSPKSSSNSSSSSSSSSWSIDPRQILIFFATLSSMGSILLIYFTLSMGKLGGDGSAP